MKTLDLLPPEVVAARLGVTVSTILKWIRRGRLRCYRCSRKTIRLDWDEVLDAIRDPVTATEDGK